MVPKRVGRTNVCTDRRVLGISSVYLVQSRIVWFLACKLNVFETTLKRCSTKDGSCTMRFIQRRRANLRLLIKIINESVYPISGNCSNIQVSGKSFLMTTSFLLLPVSSKDRPACGALTKSTSSYSSSSSSRPDRSPISRLHFAR